MMHGPLNVKVAIKTVCCKLKLICLDKP